MQLNAALNLLHPPPPSAQLDARVKGFAPAAWQQPGPAFRIRRFAIAAALLLAVGVGAMLHVVAVDGLPHTASAVTAVPTQGASEGARQPSAGEDIPLPEIALVDPTTRPAAEQFSVAVLPLD